MWLQASVYNIYIQDVQDSIPPSHCNYQIIKIIIIIIIKLITYIFIISIILPNQLHQNQCCHDAHHLADLFFH